MTDDKDDDNHDNRVTAAYDNNGDYGDNFNRLRELSTPYDRVVERKQTHAIYHSSG